MDDVRRVKICGITTQEDAAIAIRLGADALGFLVGLLYPTEDQLSPEKARSLVSSLPPLVTSVLVTHRSEISEVAPLVEAVQANTLQLHGDFSPPDILELRRRFQFLKIIKAVHVDGEGAIARALEAGPFVDAILLDTRTATRLGGTGVTHDWSISWRIRHALGDKPIILAGGLNPDNVGLAIETVQPFGVDVNTGVSERPGKKSPVLLSQFISKAKGSFADTHDLEVDAGKRAALEDARELRSRFR